MAKAPKRPADVSRAEASREVKPAKPGAPTNETARAADSVPVAVGPFTVLPTQFGRYRVEKLLGKGAMGAVYLAHDSQLDRPVALKVARVSAAGSANLIQRMETEAKAAAKIDHPLICKVHDFDEIDGIRFIALQYIEGEDLKSYLKRVGRKRDPAEAIGLILQIARALEAAHAKDVIHRDLKPENIMLNKKGEPVIMDFGLARRMTGANNAGLTQGMILGTAAYMSPEQAIGIAEDIDHRSDLYALGVMLFEMLTGEWPFTGTSMQVMGAKTICQPPSPLKLHPDLPPDLATICQKMIAQKKEDRYATCAEFIAALESVDLTPPTIEMSTAAVKASLDDSPVSSFDFLDASPAASAPPLRPISGKKNTKATRNPLGTLLANVVSPAIHWFRNQPPVFRWTLLGSASGCCALLAVVLFFQKGNALVRVEVHGKGVEVTFQNETLTLADGAHHFTVDPGEKTLHIKSGNVEFDTDKFTLKRGNNPAVTVELVKSEIVTKQGEKEIGRRPLVTDPAPRTIVDRDNTNPVEVRVANDEAGRPKADMEKRVVSPDALSPSKQVDAVIARLKELNPNFEGGMHPEIDDKTIIGVSVPSDNLVDISPLKVLLGLKRLIISGRYPVKSTFSDLTPLSGMKLEFIDCGNSIVSDLAPLTGMPLKQLVCHNTQIRDLSPLRGMPLETLDCHGCPRLSDLTPLHGLPLTSLNFYATEVASLEPLRGIPLKHLDCGGTHVSDFQPLKGGRLENLSCWRTPVTDLSPLKGLPLTRLACHETPISDLSPLKGLPLKSLSFWATKVSDITALGGMELVEVSLNPESIRIGLAILRAMPTVTSINAMPANLFWKKYDAGEINPNPIP